MGDHPLPEYPGSRITGHESLLKVAAIQMEPHVGDKAYNIDRSLELINEAADKGAKLLVLPELCASGYVFNSRNEVAAVAESIPDGPACQAWVHVARSRDCYIVAGLAEVEGGRFYNSAVFVGPEGPIGQYRKIHIWDEEKLFFEPGDLGLPIFHLPFGRVGIMICYDGWHPEVARILRLQGADIICDPTCWVLVPGVSTKDNPISAYVHMATAHQNSVFLICADRCGVERGCTFLGNSCIAGPSGFVAGPASFAETEVITAEINLMDSRHTHWTDLADPLADRRTDVYGHLLGYRPDLWRTTWSTTETMPPSGTSDTS